ncbi:MAG: PSD1 domain-containing protein [Opitutaceae bacterium]|nr:PSD1 domain-containing protein [Opitutaceae bacterium]
MPTPVHRCLRFLLIWSAASSAVAAAVETVPPAGEVPREHLIFFENEIRPLLAKRCYECHGEKKQKGDLRLDHLTRMLAGGASGPALVRGQPESSLLIEAIRYQTEDLQMPPKEALPPAEVALLEKWIAMGAPWPESDAVRTDADERGFTAEDRAFWFFQPLSRPTPPVIARPEWARNEIDRFVAARHEEAGLSPAPEADRSEFARRIYFDLHGLPPTREQLAAFLTDPAPDAHAKLVDSLLASPRYGERWAQHWLDLVRYSESDGYRADGYRPTAWRYRDYVIQSLNADKPYDQFVREQLAGDELAPDRPEVLVATSYLRNPVYEWNQRDVRGQAELILNDLTDNAGEVFLGLSMGCARCHNHKFDPILQEDYFSLRAFFEPVLWRSDLVLATREQQEEHAKRQAEWERATAEIRREMDTLAGEGLERNVKRAFDRFTGDLQAMMTKPAAARGPLEHVLATLAERQLEHERTTYDPIKSIKDPAGKTRYRELEIQLKAHDALKPKPLPAAFVATDVGPVAPVTRMKTRKGEREIQPAFLRLMENNPPVITALDRSTGRRTALAEWITRPDNPLSTRVIVNRVWQYHFGRGIAGTPNDLGHLGERPTHPELLDWLARRLVEQGWSLKALHREIVLSATYRQTARISTPEIAARVDPGNRLLWRFSPRRLDAEQTRDAVLAASGELQHAEGGPSEEANTSRRRAIYTIKKRNTPNELLRSLDAPAGFTSIAERQNTATPVQALLFLNGDWLLARARRLAAHAPTVQDIWRAALGREPTTDEETLAHAFLEQRFNSEARESEALATDGNRSRRFQENTEYERLIIRSGPREGDDFTIDAVVTLASLASGASVRTVVSRWAGEKNALEAHGWSLGVAGDRSPLRPGTLCVQLVGEDDNMNTTYEMVSSGLQLDVGVTYRLVAKISCTDGTVSFQVTDLGTTTAPPRTAVVRHSVMGKLGTGQASPVIGGLYRRSPHQFHGQIERIALVPGLPDDDMLPGGAAPRPVLGTVAWEAGQSLRAGMEWLGGTGEAESSDPRRRALTDLGHVLLNSNEFLYLH